MVKLYCPFSLKHFSSCEHKVNLHATRKLLKSLNWKIDHLFNESSKCKMARTLHHFDFKLDLNNCTCSISANTLKIIINIHKYKYTDNNYVNIMFQRNHIVSSFKFDPLFLKGMTIVVISNAFVF